MHLNPTLAFKQYKRYKRKYKKLLQSETASKSKLEFLKTRILRLKELLRDFLQNAKIAGATSVLGLLLWSSTGNAQTFGPVQNNPFSLSNIGLTSHPSLVDLDNDGDLDLMAGENGGNFKYFQNIGTAASPNFAAVLTNQFSLTDIGARSTTSFADLDNDGDLDLMSGRATGGFQYFQNTGTASAPVFGAVQTNPFSLVTVGTYNTPTFIDLDNDNDFDIMMGSSLGDFMYFENTGTVSSPVFGAPQNNPFSLTSLPAYSDPYFADLDNDGDMDLMVGENSGDFNYFQNIGTASSPNFAGVLDNPFGLTDIGFNSNPTFADLDNDGDMDIMAGEYSGNFKYFINSTLCDAEINLQGNSVSIIDGDLIPTTADHTDFGSVAECTGTIVRTFTVQNTGIANLTISSVNISGTAAADYSVTTAPASSVAAAGSTTFQITFNPSASGIRSATITINNSDCDEAAYDFAIQGTGNADIVNPTAICQNVTVNLDASGNGTVSAPLVDNGSSDACGIASMSLSQTAFDCGDVGGKIIWTDANNIHKTNYALTSTQDLITPAAALYTISVVPELEYIYIANFNAGKLQRMDYNGGGLTDIKTGVQPFGIDVDPIAGKIYWADPNANTISNCNLDGTGTAVIISGAANCDYSRVLRIDQVNGKIYWTDANLGTVKRANLDGTGLQTIVTGQGNIVGLDLDVPNNKLYFTSYSFSQVKRTNLDGTGLTVIIGATGSVPLGLSLDLVAGQFYYVNGTGGNAMKRANLNGTALTTLLSGLSQPYDISVIPHKQVTLTVTDNSGNSSTCISTISVIDAIAPVAIAQNISVNLSAAGTATITGAMVNNGSTDACGISTLSVSPSSFTCANLGNNTVTLTVTDVNGNVSTTTATVAVSDVTPPVTPTIANATGQCFVTPATPTTTDVCSGTITGTTGTTFPITAQGTTIVTWTFIDGSSNTTTANQNVIVDDITAPATPTLANVTGQCSVTPPAPTTTDACAGTITGTTGTTFPITTQGITIVTWTFNDGNGNSTTANQNVIIDDITAPVTPTLANATGQCSVTPTAPTTTDVCAGTITGTTATVFPITTQGTTIVTWTFNDGNGNSTTANQNVIIDDVTAPVTPTIANATGQCSVTPTAPTTTDVCVGTITGTTATVFPIMTQGTTVVTWTFNDGNGNSTTANQNVIIDDITAPVTPTIANATGQCSVTPTAPTTTDVCVGTITGTTATVFPITTQGTTIVTWSFNDGNGNSTTANQNVIIDDITAPVTPTIANATGQCSVTPTAPTTTDACVGTVTGTTATVFPITTQGTTIVTWSFNDGNGNSTTANQNVIIDDITAPVTPTIANATGQCSVTPTAPTTTDACVGTVTGTTATVFPITTQGTTIVTWSFNDGNGNSTTANQNVIVDDITAPVTPTLANVTGQCSVTPTTPTTTDICAGTITGTTSTSFPITSQGTTIVTWTFNDGNGNSTTANQNIIVDDITAPVTPTLADATGECSVTPTTPTTTDVCAGTIAGTTGTTFPITTQGTTIVTWTFDDGNGNSTTANQNVIVDDVTAPAISGCPSDININVNNLGCTGIVNWTSPSATDNCVVSPVMTESHTSGSVFAVGTTTVTYIFDDGNGNTSTCNFDIVVTDDFSVSSATPTHVTCNAGADGSIDLSVNGGTTPYTFDWNSGAYTDEDPSGLTAGLYNGIATDANGCTESGSITITEPDAINITVDLTTDPTGCGLNDGTASVTVTGGTEAGSYDYGWSDGSSYTSLIEDPSDLTAGSFTLTVTDDNSCTANTSFNLSDPNGPIITYNVSSDTTLNCNGDNDGTINLDIALNGGATSVTYDWNSGTFSTEDISGLTAGTYSINVTDNNNCTASATYAFGEPDAITITELVTDASCNGTTDGAIAITVTGGTEAGAYDYDWNSGTFANEDLTGIVAGNYNVIVTDDNGCTATANYTVNEPVALNVTTSLNTLTITANNATTGITYKWIDCNNGNLPIAGATNQSFTAIANGDYAVIITDGSCSDTSACVNITGLSASSLTETPIFVTAYPNPSHGSITIESSIENNFVLYNSLGQIIQTFELNIKNNYRLNIDNLSNGVYFLGNSKSATLKIVVTN